MRKISNEKDVIAPATSAGWKAVCGTYFAKVEVLTKELLRSLKAQGLNACDAALNYIKDFRERMGKLFANTIRSQERSSSSSSCHRAHALFMVKFNLN